jgi:YfiH family protein
MKYLTTPLNTIPWLRHGFFTRRDGVSNGIYASLNCGPGSGDKKENVFANRARVAQSIEISADNMPVLAQIHSAAAVSVARAWRYEDRPEADAAVTDTPGIGVSVLTADCAPVLFASKKDKIVGAAHAGWKGAVGGVLEATVAKMNCDPADIVAAIGPCIGPKSYEVSADFKIPFLAQDQANERFFKEAERAGHLYFDLPAYVGCRLRLCGVGEVHDTGQDTLADEASYFSYRRTCHRKEPDYGRQISIIAIK